jgi:hypothetical protein
MTEAEAIWYVIPCPNSVELTGISKESGTHGTVYVVYEVEMRSPLWIGQSIPALVRSINDKAVCNRDKRLHASSLYRCLRGEAKKCSHKSWKVEKFARIDLDPLNRQIKLFPSVVYVSKSPEMWRCGQPAENEVTDLDITVDDTTEGEENVHEAYKVGGIEGLVGEAEVERVKGVEAVKGVGAVGEVEAFEALEALEAVEESNLEIRHCNLPTPTFQ